MSTTDDQAVMDRSTNTEGRGYQTSIGAASLALGPLVMAVGDLLHPKESSDLGRQAAIIEEQAMRWYLAHLLLLIGLVLFVPGLLTLTGLAAARPTVVERVHDLLAGRPLLDGEGGGRESATRHACSL